MLFYVSSLTTLVHGTFGRLLVTAEPSANVGAWSQIVTDTTVHLNGAGA